MTPLQTALKLAEHGFKVLPCGDDKVPLSVDGQQIGAARASSDPTAIAHWWKVHPDAAPALVPGAGFVVVDMDLYKGGAANVCWDEILMQFPATLTVKTPSGGRHLYFKWDGRFQLKQQTQGAVGQHIDTKHGTQYVLAPGARTSAGYYEVPLGSSVIAFEDCPMLPQWIAEKIKGEKPSPGPGAVESPPHEPCSGIPPRQPARHNDLLNIAWSLRKRGVAHDAVLKHCLLLAQGWDMGEGREFEVRRLVKGAFEKTGVDPDAVLPQLGEQGEDDTEARRKLLIEDLDRIKGEVESGAELSSIEAQLSGLDAWCRGKAEAVSVWGRKPNYERKEWGVDGFVPLMGLAIYYAAGGGGKSNFIASMMQNWMLGRETFLGWGVNAKIPKRLLWVAVEDDNDDVSITMETAWRGQGAEFSPKPEILTYYTVDHRRRTGKAFTLSDVPALMDRYEADSVVLDYYNGMSGLTAENWGNAAATFDVLTDVRDYLRAEGYPGVLVNHDTKTDSFSGGQQLKNSCDLLLRMEVKEEDIPQATYLIEAKELKCKLPKKWKTWKWVQQFRDGGLWLRPTDRAEDERIALGKAQEILDVLVQAGVHGVRQAELAELPGWGRDGVRKALSKLEGMNRARKTGESRGDANGLGASPVWVVV